MAERERQPWDRCKGETRKAFEAFLCYRDLGDTRTLAATGQALGKSKGQMEIWSAKWGWLERVAAYEESTRAEAEHRAFEARIDEQLQEQAERERQRKTRLGGARVMRMAGSMAAAELLAALQAGEHKQQITCEKCGAVVGTDRLEKLIGLAGKAALMFDKGAMHERLEEKEPTVITEHRMPREKARQIADVIRRRLPPELWEEAAAEVDSLLNGHIEAEIKQ